MGGMLKEVQGQREREGKGREGREGGSCSGVNHDEWRRDKLEIRERRRRKEEEEEEERSTKNNPSFTQRCPEYKVSTRHVRESPCFVGLHSLANGTKKCTHTLSHTHFYQTER